MADLDHRRFLAQDYAIINPMQVGLDQRGDLETVTLTPRGFERHARMMPLLLELKALPEARRLELLERAERRSRDNDTPLFSALLASDADAERLRFHLMRNMLLSRPEGGEAWLRFHVPRVFRHLRWIFDETQLEILLGPIGNWTWYDPLARQWHVHERTGNGRLFVQKLRMSPEQWAALEQLEALNRCLLDLAGETGTAPDDGSARQCLDALHEARRQGLREMADRCLYARQCLCEGNGFHGREETRSRLSIVRDQGISYVAACTQAGVQPVLPDR